MEEITFDESEFDLLDRALRTDPDLRLATYLALLLRRGSKGYPIELRDGLKSVLPETGIHALGHRLPNLR
jgi:hypothetical protein